MSGPEKSVERRVGAAGAAVEYPQLVAHEAVGGCAATPGWNQPCLCGPCRASDRWVGHGRGRRGRDRRSPSRKDVVEGGHIWVMLQRPACDPANARQSQRDEA